MDGYTLSHQLRKARRRYRLSATSQALYYELVAIANEEGWPGTFRCSNGELCSALAISEKTLVLARQELIVCQLITYASGKNRRCFSQYGFNTTVNFTAKPAPITAPISAPITPDYNKLNLKPKQKPAEEVITHASAFEFFRSTKNHRLLTEKFGLNGEAIEAYFKTFYDSKIDLGDLNHKTREEIARNFYYWLPKHLAANADTNKHQSKNNNQPVRGVAAALKFANVKMRDE